MLVILKRDNEEVNEQAAHLIAGAIKKKPSLVLGLATGNTMVGLFKHLVRLYRAGSLDFSQVTTFNLDEYLGLPASHPQSFHHFIWLQKLRHSQRNAKRICSCPAEARTVCMNMAISQVVLMVVVRRLLRLLRALDSLRRRH